VTASPPANLRGEHDLGEILGYAWQVYARHFQKLFVVALIAAPMQMLTTIIVRRIEDDSTAQAAGIYLLVPITIIELIAVLAIIRIFDDVALGSAPDAGPAVDTGLQRFWPTLTAEILAGMRTLASVLAVPFLAIYWLVNRDATIDGRRDWYFATIPLALPAYLWVRWYFIPNSVVVEGKRSWHALDDSAEAVRGQWWRTLGIVIVISLLRVLPVSMIAAVTVYAHPVVDGALTGLVAALTLPLAAGAQTLLYYDLKARNAVDVHSSRVDDPQSDVPREGA
jgi:hypothetical protein